MRVVLPGGAGLVGQNLTLRLSQQGYEDVVVLDKHRENALILQKLAPKAAVRTVDLAQPGEWQQLFSGADTVVLLQAQIGGHSAERFRHNNIDATRNVLAAMQRHGVSYLVHVSSSVVESVASDDYTGTKKAQEAMVAECGIPHVILRPTLMFGWFDRKHLGWLSRFMQRSPLFPIPGTGRFPRQPLYVGDFCAIISRCLQTRHTGGPYNISGLEMVDYVDIIRTIRDVTGTRTAMLHLPYSMFHLLLRVWGLFDRDPPFTPQQLEALVAGDRFEIIDWPGIFGVEPTPFTEAVELTFKHPEYSNIKLHF